MKKRTLILLIAAALALGTAGCGEEKKAGESVTEEVDSFTEEMSEELDGQFTAPSEAVTNVVANTWNTQDGAVYVLNGDGTGTKDGEALEFECGFDDEKNITLLITMKDSEEESLYAISTDKTGYGIDLTSLDGGEDMVFRPAGLEFLDAGDERVKALVGEWSDESGNGYAFDAQGNVTISSADKDTDGTYSVVADESGDLYFRIVVEGGSLEFAYTLSDDGTGMDLVAPGTDTVHHWTKG